METERRPISIGDDGATGACCGPVAPLRSGGDLSEAVRILAALADPTRLAIVELLAAQDEPLCVCEIVPRFALGQPTISHHLRVLREARLVTWDKRGLWVYYALDRATLSRAGRYLGGLVAERGQPAGAGQV